MISCFKYRYHLKFLIRITFLYIAFLKFRFSFDIKIQNKSNYGLLPACHLCLDLIPVR